MLTPPDVAALADFTGRPVESFSAYTETALAQATLLFQIATGLEEWPTDPAQKQLACYAVLELADKMVLSQPYAATQASPFQSETIGSYSYSRMQQKVLNFQDTGLLWFDLAVNKLKVPTAGGTGISSGGISIFERDGLSARDGQLWVPGPKDKNKFNYGYEYLEDPSEPWIVPAGSPPPLEGTGGVSAEVAKVDEWSYVHYQDIPSVEWVVEHGGNRVPEVTVLDERGDEIIPTIDYVDNNTLKIISTKPYMGTAYLT